MLNKGEVILASLARSGLGDWQGAIVNLFYIHLGQKDQ